MTKRRTLWDAVHDKIVELVDSVDVSELLTLDAPKKKPKKLVVDTTAEDVISSDDGRTADPAPASNRSEPPSD